MEVSPKVILDVGPCYVIMGFCPEFAQDGQWDATLGITTGLQRYLCSRVAHLAKVLGFLSNPVGKA